MPKVLTFLVHIAQHPLTLFIFLFWVAKLKAYFAKRVVQKSKKKLFLRSYPDYGYSGKIDHIRKIEFERLQGTTYLDHAGTTLYAKSQILQWQQTLLSTIYGNPHSKSGSSRMSTDSIEKVREQVLGHLGTSSAHYSVIFTSGATGALKLVAEMFPWKKSTSEEKFDGSEFCCLEDNHNSVLGIRVNALLQGAQFTVVDDNLECTCPSPGARADSEDTKDLYHLFAFPAESNFSGVQYDLNLISKVQQGGLVGHARQGQWKVLVDAAKFVTTSFLDLSKYPADFVCVSFYKMFGYPSGLGALIVRNDSVPLLTKKYFGGGTVEASLSSHAWQRFRKGASERFEDGTVSFLSITSLTHGFRIINSLGLANITNHVRALTRYLHQHMKSLRHENGSRVCEIYGYEIENKSSENIKCGQGGILTCNFLKPSGEYVGYAEVENLASNVANIHIRTGCFCNPGACSRYLCQTSDEIKANLEAGHVCWDDHDLVHGKPTGAVRVSLGYMSTFEDVQNWIKFVERFFVQNTPLSIPTSLSEKSKHLVSKTYYQNYNSTDSIPRLILKRILVYPIKSCGAMIVSSWPIGLRGFQYDREWSIVNPRGTAYTQKIIPDMCKIRPWIDLEKQLMTIIAPGMEPLLISLNPNDKKDQDDDSNNNNNSVESSDLKVCGFECKGRIYSTNVARWFTKFLGRSCNLARSALGEKTTTTTTQSATTTTTSKQEKLQGIEEKDSSETPRTRSDVSFANDGQFLLVTDASVNAVLSEKEQNETQDEIDDESTRADRFRPNLVVGLTSPHLFQSHMSKELSYSNLPFEEDQWESIRIGTCRLKVVGSCYRCTMVNVNQETGAQDKGVFSTLATVRPRDQGKIKFGVLLDCNEADQQISIGMPVLPQPLSV